MFGDFLGRLLEFFEFLWPLFKIEQWEGGIYSVFGKFRKVLGPGIYPRVPWFVTIHSTSLAWRPLHSGRHDITLKDGKVFTFEAVAMFRVRDLRKSMVVVHDDEHAMLSLLISALAEKLAEVDPDRFLPDRRGRLYSSLQSLVTEEAAEFGLEVKWVRFTTFILDPKTYRLLAESAPAIA